MSPEDLINVQSRLQLSDAKMASALGVTRQTWRNWRRGLKCPANAQNSIRWMLELRRLDPTNDNIPRAIRFVP
jgi:DNA-binding transcriptional regulator YiaG